MNFIADLDRGAIRQQHPRRDLQPFSGSINNTDRAIFPLGPAEDLKSRTIKRMERIENLDLGAFRGQGIVGADVIILIFTALCREADHRRIILAGSARGPVSSCR
jgi:hypothetical protein